MSRSVTCNTSRAFVGEMPGKVVGMYNRSPSYSGGMNSDPMFWNGNNFPMATAAFFNPPAESGRCCTTSRFHGRKTHSTLTAATTMTVRRQRITMSINGWYIQINSRLMGFRSSAGILPRINQPIKIGASVIESSAAAAMEYVLVNASGLNSRPSCSCNVNTGRNETVITSKE